MSGDELPSHYSGLMKNLGQGYALYKPVQVSDLSPGICGYFDRHGDWVPILDIFNLPDDANGPYKKMEMPPELKKVGPEEWSPQYSEGVDYVAVPIEAAASAPGAPGSVGVELKFTSSKVENAVLIAGPVTKEFFPFESRFQEWCDANFAAIIREFRDVKEHGLWIITKTCHTDRWRISTWRQKSRTVSIGLSADAVNAAKITGKGSWGQKAAVGGWRGMDAPENEADKISNHYVIFVGGLKYKYSKLTSALGRPPHGGPIPKGHDDKKTVDVNGESLECSLVTKVGMKDTYE
ncbi:hypothetical protein AnigIFM63309_003805 [Aspergillus niger]|nr:hypothetical protein AnigIFM50267_002300 [Aspergillus niger]GLA14558.1 hypothetical protein AnigIFM62618_000940 [Aspergillus niger]GLA33784.1 hypothetical protein AnigIFM63309_003805 [Aspergillus niger]